MILTKIEIKNFRLLINTKLDVDKDITLIVGRNNTAKTSCMDLIEKVLNGGQLSYDDYPLQKRKYAHFLLECFMQGRITYDRLCQKFPQPSIEFFVDYSLDDPDDNLGALSPFIIDVDVDTTQSIIRAEYKLKMEECTLRELFTPCFFEEGAFVNRPADVRDTCISNFHRMFDLNIYAINPNDSTDVQIKTQKELSELFPFYPIHAERFLGEASENGQSSLGSLITNYFSVDLDNLDPQIVADVKTLRETVEKANIAIQRQSSALLSSIVDRTIGFGYPNGEELKLGVNTKLQIDNQIKDRTELTYSSPIYGESLPSSYNGLGYKNLIKMEFQLAVFASKIKQGSAACIPLLFIEEPESHMHPQMQHTFASYLGTFLAEISEIHIQTFLTSHSAHIANTIDFSQIRYAQKTKRGVVYKDLNVFSQAHAENIDFIQKYLTLSRCDMFFADKVIFVEGASERLLLPDVIAKCTTAGLFDSQEYKLPAQYYALIEIGGAYAYKFIPFVEFLGIPCLILTDIDSMEDGRTKAVVSKGKVTSNSTLKWWMRKHKNLPEDDTNKIDLAEIIALTADQKTRRNCHIEFQTSEGGLCGRSLEEAVMNVNRTYFELTAPVTEESLSFEGKSKTDFALNLITEKPDYEIPQYIKDGLIWLNDQQVLV